MTRMLSSERLDEIQREPALSVERRVLATVICNPDKLEIAADLEPTDFTHPHHHQIFSTLRNLQALDRHIGILEIAERIVDEDVRLGTALAETIGPVFITDIVANSPRYEDVFGEEAAVGVFQTDLKLLRDIATARRKACV